MPVQVQSTQCRSALTRTGIPGVQYALNPYTGCTHACVYCYASFMKRFSGHTEPWGTWVDAKENIALVFRKELARMSSRCRRSSGGPGDTNPTIMLSSVTDPYQPIEGSLGLTRACLEVVAEAIGVSRQTSLGLEFDPPVSFAPEVSVLTKSALVTRDIPILRDLPGSEVGMTITTLDDALARQIEPGASAPGARLRALEQLAHAQIRTWAFISPVLPYYSDSSESLSTLIKRIADTGVSRIAVDRLNLYPAAVSGFAKASCPEAVKALRDYKSSPQTYLTRLRDAVLEAAAEAGAKVPIKVFF